VKASQCFTKYKWRDDAAAAREGGPQIVATQVPVLAILSGPSVALQAPVFGCSFCLPQGARLLYRWCMRAPDRHKSGACSGRPLQEDRILMKQCPLT
jgi:hypothetical protein